MYTMRWPDHYHIFPCTLTVDSNMKTLVYIHESIKEKEKIYYQYGIMEASSVTCMVHSELRLNCSSVEMHDITNNVVMLRYSMF